MRKFISILASAFLGLTLAAQAPSDVVKWKAEAKETGENEYEIVFTGDVKNGWHTYDVSDGFNATTIEFAEGVNAIGKPYNISVPTKSGNDMIFEGTAVIGQKVSAKEGETVSGTLTYVGCNDTMCTPPEDWDFSVTLGTPQEVVADEAHSTAISDPEEENGASTPLWPLILEAILWGFAMLLTPCVFPMVPMTVSFFLKSSENAAAGRFKAFMYGLFIVLLYTVPISIIILLTRVIGGEAVTADIFNWLSTHWLPNIIFFIVFMIFAASFFGAFEIVLPSGIVNKSDSKSRGAGLGGVFFMALTLVLVSFSCTGPIVGSVLIKSTQGEFWTPMVTMLAFSIAFALPFTLLAFFPTVLKKMKGATWLNSVKVVLGFIEVALGFKFLSVADQTYHWGILDRHVYLAIWIVTFSLLGFYLLGKIRFKNDEKVESIGVVRLALAIAVFSFVVYMIPGMWGAPLKALSGYLPPLETQDFIVYNHADGAPTANVVTTQAEPTANKYDLKMPLGLQGYFTLEEGLKASKEANKPLFVDITGHGCVNCREMEQRVWSDPRVLKILNEDYVLVALYTDDKSKLAKEDWVTTESGKVLKDLGRVNSYIARTRFGVNAQPNYALLDSDGNLLVPVRGYNLDVDAFISFLNSGLEKFRN